ncbi:hypothetical protein ACET3Z_010206 [Daucus carota]
MARPQMFYTTLFISLLTVVASTPTTVTKTTTTIIIDDPSIINSRCKYVDVRSINHCKMYLTPDPSSSKNAQTTHLTECCGQLDELETKCRCMAIKEVLWNLKNQKSMSGKSLWESEELEQMEQDAEDLPTKCNVELKEPATTITTITTTIVDENAEECAQSIEPMKQLNHCMKYISPKMSPMNAHDEHKKECCTQFKNIKKSCRCKAIKEMVRQQQQGQMESDDRDQMVKDAMNIPSICKINMPKGQCDIQTFYF